METFLSMLLALSLSGPGGIQSATPDAKAQARPATIESQTSIGLIDINRSRIAELAKLDGIGDAWAGAIVRGRPYTAIGELVAKNVIPRAAYEKVKESITARQK